MDSTVGWPVRTRVATSSAIDKPAAAASSSIAASTTTTTNTASAQVSTAVLDIRPG